jgi:hypothetical protein
MPVAGHVPAEPSWGRVLLTTIDLWASRRLRHASFLRRQVHGPRSRNRVRLRLGPLRIDRSGRQGSWKLLLAVAAAAAVALVSLGFAGTFLGGAAPRAVRPTVSQHAVTHGVFEQQAPTAQSEAIAWIIGQVDDDAIIGCYPAICAALQVRGISASRLVLLGSRLTGVLRTDVIVTLPTDDERLVDQYAPALIASFGSGSSRIEVRAVAPSGTAAYQSALRTDLSARKSAGAQLLRNPRIRFSAEDAALLRAGEVDSRLLATLAALSSQYAFRVTAFGDSSPGAPVLFREVTVVSDGRGNGAAMLAAALAMVNAQESPYLPAYAATVRLGTGQAVLRIEFASPSPLGLLTTVLTDDVQPRSA